MWLDSLHNRVPEVQSYTTVVLWLAMIIENKECNKINCYTHCDCYTHWQAVDLIWRFVFRYVHAV